MNHYFGLVALSLVFVWPAGLRAEPPATMSDELARPFSFFLASSDVVGFKDSPEGFQLVNDGSLISSFGQFSLSAGSPPRPMDARVKTLYRDYLPIFEYGFQRDGVEYEVRTWGMTQALDSREDLTAFIQVAMRNPGAAPATAGLLAEFGPVKIEGRKPWPCTPWYRDRFMNEAAFSDQTRARVADGEAWLGGHLVFTCTGKPATGRSGASVAYSIPLAPGAEEAVTFKVPYVPIAEAKTPPLEALRNAKAGESFAAVVRFWDDLLARGARLELPEAKAMDTVRAGLCYLLCARDVDETGKKFIQKVNEFQYDDFYPRDSAYMIRVYEMYGQLDIARQTLESYLVRGEKGAVERFERMPQHPDDWGQSLWTLGAYFRTTGDAAFAKEVLPGIAPHLDDFENSTRDDPLGLWPVAPPYDNELIDGHYTGHNFWAVLGLREAKNLALAAGDAALAERAQKLLDGFLPVLMKRLEEVTRKTGGYIPPGLDDPEAGFDWENATGGVYPFGVLPPDHPWVVTTTGTAREYKWREGISTWGPNGWTIQQQTLAGGDPRPGTMHHYQTFNVVEPMLAMGREREVVEDLYSILAHTSSTHAGFELGMDPWGNRDPDGNFPPHGWFAARYCELIRNMLLREEGETLHLASALPPRWVRPGDMIRFTGAPTYFGPVSLAIASRDDGAEVTIDARWRTPPKTLLLHIPWFVEVESAATEAGPARVESRTITLPPTTQKCTLKWRWTETPDLSYERAVNLWLSKAYDPRPETDRNFLFPRPARPKLVDSCRMFTDTYELRLLSPTPSAEIHYTLDGTDPTPKSPLYEAPVTLRETTTVRAIEVWPDGRVSAPLMTKLRKAPVRQADIPPDRAGELEPGLSMQVWDGEFDVLPNFAKGEPQKTGVAATFDLGATGRENVYAARFAGYVRVPRDGVYSFTVGSDDGSRLWIGDELVVDNDKLHPYAEVTGQIPLKAGFHAIAVGFFDKGGAAHLRVFYEGPGVKRQGIPAEALFRKKGGK